MTEQTAQPRSTPSAAASLTVRIAQRYGIDADKMLSTLKATAFRQRPDKDTGKPREPTHEEMLALLTIAERYGLDPFTRELFAYLDVKSGAIVPVVSVDGWIRIINDRPELRSISFGYSDETREHKGKTVHAWIECRIARSDRDLPVVIREYFDEVVRTPGFATPWDTHPNRMHRHKTLIQAARVAFGFGGIYDEDEAHRIIEGTATPVRESPTLAAINAGIRPASAPAPAMPAVEHRPAETIPATVGANVADKVPAVEAPTFAEVADAMRAAKDADAFGLAVDRIRFVRDEAHRAELERIAVEIRNGGA